MEQQPRYIDRPPRIQPELPVGEVGIPSPPQEEQARNRSLIQLFLPMITIMGYLLISVFGRGRSLLFMVPMGISVLASVGVALYTRFKDQENQGRSQAAYAERLVELRKEMNVKHDMQRRFYRYNYPDPNMVQQIAAEAYQFSGKPGGGESDQSKRIWERRSSDSDFGMLRLGIGVRPSSVSYALEEKGSAGTFDNPLYRDALRLQDDARFVDNTPITIPLREKNMPNSVHDLGKSSARHAIGITGSHSYAVYAFVQALLAHFAVFHSPNNARIQIVGIEAARNQWRWASNLPHCMTAKDSSLVFESDKDRAGDRDRNRLNQYLKGMRKLYDDRKMRAADDSSSQDMRLPLNLLVVDLLPEIPDGSVLSEVESDPAISIVLNEGQSIGGAVLVLVPHQEKIPSNCQAMIEVVVSEVDQELNTSGGRKKISFRYVETGVNTPRYIGEAEQESDLDKLTRLSQHLAPLMVRQSYGSDLPRGVMMMDMLKVRTIEELRTVTQQTWAHSVTPDLADWLKVTLGTMSGGDLRTLQFAAHADGVHGLIAGSTGSGKSELLMTMIIGLALNYDPTIVNFVLVDFKGGAAFEPFRHLPHCVDIVTNLAGAGVERMFAAITAELNRRQAINVATDSKHIVHYRKRSLHEPPYGSTVEIKSNQYKTAPYPHLFVFIDEFAEMISDNPAYKAQLDTITRLGRALGVTLILAAQRPTGVTDQMRANIKFRISLRVETREESSEVLRRPDAAYLPTDIPGRGYLQVGNENIELIQVAWTGADYRGGHKKEKPKIIWHDRPRDQEDEPGEDELPKVYEVMVDMMDDLSKEVSLAQRKPWPDFLPSVMDLLSDIDGSYVNENELLWFNPDP
ncbi:MAG: FtsK/SpoIIIE domain-containing protein, partial [Chloroflexota bacterium]